MRGYFNFDGENSIDKGLVIEYRPDYPSPKKKTEVITIPGKNGTLHYLDESYDNTELCYECWFKGDADKSHEIKSWLLSKSGYIKLLDTYDTSIYRLARIDSLEDIENVRGKFGKFKVKFDCRPECYLASGDNPITFISNGTITNPTSFKAYPIIRAYATGNIIINGKPISINTINGYVDINCETMQAYKDNTNCNGNISCSSFPFLNSGANDISTSIKIDIIPRWWTL